MEIKALQSGSEEIKKLKILSTQKALSEQARQKMNFLLNQLEEEIDKKESEW